MVRSDEMSVDEFGSHDLERALCRFWLRGTCAKNEQCEFLHHLPKDLANKRALLDIIQAEVLISFYFLDIGKSVDGPYHSNSAVSLCLGARLNLVHSPDANAASVVDPGTDAERIRAFWTCLVLDNYWSIAHGSPSALESIKIDTPWPE